MRATALLAAAAGTAATNSSEGGDTCVRPSERHEPRYPPHQSECRRPRSEVMPAEEAAALQPTFERQSTRLGFNVSRSKCSVTAQRAECAVQETTIGGRPVFYQVPDGSPPSGGWPVMLYFHAWYAGGRSDWAANYPNQPNQDGGVYWEVATKKALLDMGVAWISPDATRNGNPCPNNRNCWWETNCQPYASQDLDVWTSSHDHKFLVDLFSAMEGGTFGSLNTNKMHTGGYSSGGFMASRMPFSYPEKGWRSKFNVAGSVYYCCGCGLQYCNENWLTQQPLSGLMPGHAPTLFLHGAADRCVTPLESAMYDRRLQDVGVTTKYVSPSGQQHHWLPSSAEEVAAWVARYN